MTHIEQQPSRTNWQSHWKGNSIIVHSVNIRPEGRSEAGREVLNSEWNLKARSTSQKNFTEVQSNEFIIENSSCEKRKLVIDGDARLFRQSLTPLESLKWNAKCELQFTIPSQ